MHESTRPLEGTEINMAQLTAEIVSTYVGNNTISAEELPNLISQVHLSISNLGNHQPEEQRPEPAVSIRNSVKPDYIVCLEDGKKLKMLKRHLMTAFNMTPEQYRARWDLPSDYPMVAPNYAEKRRELAKKIGLGRNRTTTTSTVEVSPSEAEGSDNARKGRGKAKAKAEAAPKTARRTKSAAKAAVEAAPKTKRGRPAKNATA